MVVITRYKDGCIETVKYSNPALANLTKEVRNTYPVALLCHVEKTPRESIRAPPGPDSKSSLAFLSLILAARKPRSTSSTPATWHACSISRPRTTDLGVCASVCSEEPSSMEWGMRSIMPTTTPVRRMCRVAPQKTTKQASGYNHDKSWNNGPKNAATWIFISMT
ncbi:hypothetical protein BDW02DRAFT_233606 [Decorospora gaudefroyi]|uniref:Uncharacterized protein n=1 Tax=Decorospora gaudefroyi TaxID=184978 RepID=A0A6A5KVA3_9PLEO|nr:hypothetical protein BDW02DRAFT_233606 [Decorospora gaudefroyi]